MTKNKIFNIEGQKFKSRYVNRIQYLNRLDYGYVNIILNSGSSINLPSKESFITWLFETDFIEPDATI